MSAGDRAARNAGLRAVAEVVGKICTFLLFAVLARETGQDGVGAFVLALAFLFVVMTPAGLGLDSWYLREASRDRTAVGRLFYDLLALKLAMTVPVLALGFAAMSLLGYEPEVRETVYVLSVGIVFEQLGKTTQTVFNAVERAGLLGATLIVQRVLGTALGIAVLAAGYGVVTVAAAYSAGAVVAFALGLVLVHRRVGVPRLSVRRAGWPGLVRTSAPYAVQSVVNGLLARADTIVLSVLATQAAIGRYGAAYRLLETTLFVAWALNGAFAAMYAYLGRDTSPTIGSVFHRSVKAGVVILLPAAVATGLLAEPLCRLAFGADFEAAAEPLRLLAPVVLLQCLVILNGSLIISRLGPGPMLRATVGALVLNLAANAVLIPSLEDSGAALAMLASQTVLFAATFAIAAREVGGVDLGRLLGAPVAAGAAMAAVLVLLAGEPAAALAAGVAIYAAVYAGLERIVSPGDLTAFAGVLRARR